MAWYDFLNVFKLIPLCCPAGEVLRGDRITNTPFEVKMASNQGCQVLCKKPGEPITLDKKQSALVAKRIEQEYNVHL